MKSHYLRNKLGRIMLALSFLVVVGVAASGVAQAQRPWDRDQDRNDQNRRDRESGLPA